MYLLNLDVRLTSINKYTTKADGINLNIASTISGTVVILIPP